MPKGENISSDNPWTPAQNQNLSGSLREKISTFDPPDELVMVGPYQITHHRRPVGSIEQINYTAILILFTLRRKRLKQSKFFTVLFLERNVDSPSS